MSMWGAMWKNMRVRMGLYHPLDGVTNLKYKLLYFLTPNKKNFKEKGASFKPGQMLPPSNLFTDDSLPLFVICFRI
jgi:hypothetical protein